MKIVYSEASYNKLVIPWLTENNISYKDTSFDTVEICGCEQHSFSIKMKGKCIELSDDDFVLFLIRFNGQGEFFNNRQFYIML